MAKQAKANKRGSHFNIVIPSFLILHFHTSVAESLPLVYCLSVVVVVVPVLIPITNSSSAQHLSPIMSDVPATVEQANPEVSDTTPAAVEPIQTEDSPAVVSLIFQVYFSSPLILFCPSQTETPAPVVEETPQETPATDAEDQKEAAKPVREKFSSTA